jgi:hypothetical protein
MKVNCIIRQWTLYILLFHFAFSFIGCCTCQNSAPVEEKGDRTIQSQKGYVAGELFIKFKSEVSDEEIRGFLDRHGFTVIKKMEDLEVYHVKIPGNHSVLELIETLSKESPVQYVEPNYIRSTY